MPLPELFPWQQRELDARRPDKWAWWASPRLGKTYVAALDLRRRFDEAGIRRAVVTAPVRVLPIWRTWLHGVGLDTIAGFDLPTAEVKAMLKARPEGVLLINDDRLGLGDATAHGHRTNLIDPIIRWVDEGAYVADESHRLANPSSQRGRSSRRLMHACKWGRQLTGTPVPNHYGNLWGQLSALDPQGFETYTEFKARYLICNPVFPAKIEAYRDLEQLRALILSVVSVVRREDVFGPDHWQYIERRIALPPDVRAIYDKLAHDWILDGHTDPVLNVLARLTRFQQISSGFMPNDTGGIRELHREKVDAVLGDLGEIVASREKAVVVHRFTWEGEQIEAGLKRDHVANRFVINGNTSADAAEKIQNEFRAAKSGVAVVQIQSGGEGLDFATARHALIASQDFSFIHFEQVRDRIFAPGLARTVTFYRMDDTVDDFIAEVVNTKQDLHSVLRNVDKASLVLPKRNKVK